VESGTAGVCTAILSGAPNNEAPDNTAADNPAVTNSDRELEITVNLKKQLIRTDPKPTETPA
jgi:hypothetical protein